MKYIVIAAAMLASTPLMAATSKESPDEIAMNLVATWQDYRSSGNNTEMEKTSNQLANMGWCYGTGANPPSEWRWHICGSAPESAPPHSDDAMIQEAIDGETVNTASTWAVANVYCVVVRNQQACDDRTKA